MVGILEHDSGRYTQDDLVFNDANEVAALIELAPTIERESDQISSSLLEVS
jgi:hypothetical protein